MVTKNPFVEGGKGSISSHAVIGRDWHERKKQR